MAHVTDIAFELSCLQTYLKIIRYLIERLEKVSSLEDDLLMLQDTNSQKSCNEKMAIVYRSERKKILQNQYIIIAYLIKVLTESLTLQRKYEQNVLSYDECKLEFFQSYLNPTEKEAEQFDILSNEESNDPKCIFKVPVFDCEENE